MITVVPFTDAEKVDILRYCGYPAYGIEATYDPFGLYFPTWNQPTPALPDRMVAVLSIARQKLTEMASLDAAIVSAGSRLSTASAAVWTRNQNEVRDRQRLFDMRRRALCTLLGVAPGPELGTANAMACVA